MRNQGGTEGFLRVGFFNGGGGYPVLFIGSVCEGLRWGASLGLPWSFIRIAPKGGYGFFCWCLSRGAGRLLTAAAGATDEDRKLVVDELAAAIGEDGWPINHARYYWLLLAESHLTRRLFGSMLRRIAALPLPTG
jgi:hypothetical protein